MSLRLPLAVLLLCIALPSAAQTIYRHVDANGVVHYSDRRPADVEEVSTIRLRAEQQMLAALRVDGRGSRRHAIVGNRINGPLQVELRFEGAMNATSDPPLPLRVVLAADSERPVAELRPSDPYQDSRFGLSMNAVPGDPSGTHEDVVYLLPVDSGAWRIDQGFDGSFSHNEPPSRYAIDIAVEEGTPVLAARAGTVMQVERHFEGAGLDREKYGGRANHVRILHDDGSMAVYAHLKADSVVVRPGARVRAGQRIASSGNTGFSTGPHLHFAVQLNRGMQLESVPFRMQGPAGAVAIPGAH
jgi:murein DD-endopeptidase MepM/ murein hydrolase activator NlpD